MLKLPSQINFIINRLESNGFSAYAVGGCVRDSLMGRIPGDYDITTSALPEDMVRIFSDCRVIETGLKHGTLTVLYGGMSVEITTYRIDGVYKDGRRPDSVVFTDDLSTDLSRRDFTVNAMAYSEEKGLIDDFGGVRDISLGIIRCVGEADRRFGEDGLRILRALRFSSVLDFTPDECCSASLRKLTPLLDCISRERIYTELTKLLGGKGCRRVLCEYADVIDHILPIGTDNIMRAGDRIAGTGATYAFESAFREFDGLIRDFDVFGTVRCREMLYALLFAECELKTASELFSSLKPSRAEKNALMAILEHKDYVFSKDDMERSVTHLISHTEDSLPVMLAVFGYLCGKHTLQYACEIIHIASDIIKNDKPRSLRDLKISGSELTALGISGKQIGDTLHEMLERVIDGEVGNTKEELLETAKAIS